jgi:hypothetical protein
MKKQGVDGLAYLLQAEFKAAEHLSASSQAPLLAQKLFITTDSDHLCRGQPGVVQADGARPTGDDTEASLGCGDIRRPLIQVLCCQRKEQNTKKTQTCKWLFSVVILYIFWSLLTPVRCKNSLKWISFNPILHTAWLDNHALTLKRNSAKYYFHEKSRFLHTFLKFCCKSRKI